MSEPWIEKYARFMAKCEARRILAKVELDPLTIFAISKIEPLPYQLEDFLSLVQALETGNVRALLAYETGLGKTIVSGLFIREVLLRKPDARILLVLPPMSVSQWLYEMDSKFGIRFNVFQEENDLAKRLLAASMDTLKKRVERVRERGTKWDVIVVDELHRATPENLRYKLLELLRDRTDHLLALTATPHDGKQENFIARLNLILASVTQDNYRVFLRDRCFRRRKDEVTDLKGRRLFPYPVSVDTETVSVTREEEEFYNAVEEYVRTQYNLAKGRVTPIGLVATILGRIASSSVVAGVAAMKRRKNRLLKDSSAASNFEVLIEMLKEAEDNQEETDSIYQQIIEQVIPEKREILQKELNTINKIIELGEKTRVDSKLNQLEKILRTHIEKGEKIVVFTSFVDTALHIYSELSRRLGCHVYIATGRIDQDERKDNIRKFIDDTEACVLVGTEVIGESLNLQAANVVINYELPWSPIPYIQRVGRVYRYPQKKQIFVHNFSSNLKVERRVLDVVYRKVQRLIEDFDEGSVAVIGNQVSEDDIAEAIFEAYTRGEEEAKKRLEERLVRAEENIEIMKKAMNLSQASARHIDASALLSDPSELVTEGDIRNFLKLAVKAGIGRGNPSVEPVQCYVRDSPVRKLMVEDPAVKEALKLASNLKTEYVCFIWDKEEIQAKVVEAAYLDGEGKPFLKEILICTPKGYFPFKILDRLEPANYEVNSEEFDCPDDDSYLRKRKGEVFQRLSESAQYKLELLDTQIESINTNSPLEIFEKRKLERQKEQISRAAGGLKFIIVDTLGYIRFLSGTKQYNIPGYDPVAIRRKNEVEKAAMEYVMKFEKQECWEPLDIHQENLGYDVESIRIHNGIEQRKQIEVKGLSTPSDEVVLTHNEFKASEFFKDTYWLYVVFDPLGNPRLHKQRPPFKVKKEIIVVQYAVQLEDQESKTN
jgi:superfamily II DNA or RNA helicase